MSAYEAEFQHVKYGYLADGTLGVPTADNPMYTFTMPILEEKKPMNDIHTQLTASLEDVDRRIERAQIKFDTDMDDLRAERASLLKAQRLCESDDIQDALDSLQEIGVVILSAL